MTYGEHQEQQQGATLPACPLCGNEQYQREEGRLDSRWGFSSHRIILLICTRCRYILQFYDAHSIWDFD